MLKVVDPTTLKTMSRDTLQDFWDAACVLFVFYGCLSYMEPEPQAVARLQERVQKTDNAFLLIDMLNGMGIDEGPKLRCSCAQWTSQRSVIVWLGGSLNSPSWSQREAPPQAPA